MDFSQGPVLGAAIPHSSDATSLSYHEDGVHLFAACQEDSKLYMIHSLTGKIVGDYPYLKCEREGLNNVTSTHHDYTVLATSHTQNTINYWSLYDNKLLRKFRGHTAPVLDVSLCPSEDLFLTSSKDQTVRLWNLSQAGCIAELELPPDKTSGSPHVAFDATGMVFAVMAEMTGNQGHYIHLYDARNFSGGAFSELQLTMPALQEAMQTHRIPSPSINSMYSLEKIDFNVSGNRMLVQSPQAGLFFVLDGFEGTVQRVFQSSPKSVACFTPDDQSLMVGSDKSIDCYNIQSGSLVRQLESRTDDSNTNGTSPITALACNPKYRQIASGYANHTCLWIW